MSEECKYSKEIGEMSAKISALNKAVFGNGKGLSDALHMSANSIEIANKLTSKLETLFSDVGYIRTAISGIEKANADMEIWRVKHEDRHKDECEENKKNEKENHIKRKKEDKIKFIVQVIVTTMAAVIVMKLGILEFLKLIK